MKQLLSFFGLARDKGANQTAYTSIETAIEDVVSGTEPRIRLVSGYAKKLRRSVTVSLDYIDKLVENIPEPVETNSKTFAKDPEVNAYFASLDDLQLVFSQSPELKAFFDDSANNEYTEAYALLCMNRTEKAVMGTELAGEMLRREVMQTAVNFSDHKILSPAASEAAIRRGLKKCIFDALITRALQSITKLKIQQAELKDQQRILSARLRARLAQGNGLTKLLSTAQVDQGEVRQLEEQIAETEQSLKEMPAISNAPLAYLNEVDRIMSAPEAFIELEIVSLQLTQMCIKATEETSQPSHTIHFAELDVANVLKRVVVIVRFPRNDMLRGQLDNNGQISP